MTFMLDAIVLLGSWYVFILAIFVGAIFGKLWSLGDANSSVTTCFAGE